jgi:hypothetical protein
MESDIIKEKWIKTKDFIDRKLHQHNSSLFYLLGIITGLMFMIGYIVYNIIGGIISFLIGILLFEFFKYFYNVTPDIIISGFDDEEQATKILTNSIKDAINNNDEDNNIKS